MVRWSRGESENHGASQGALRYVPCDVIKMRDERKSGKEGDKKKIKKENFKIIKKLPVEICLKVFFSTFTVFSFSFLSSFSLLSLTERSGISFSKK